MPSRFKSRKWYDTTEYDKEVVLAIYMALFEYIALSEFFSRVFSMLVLVKRPVLTFRTCLK